MSTRQKNLALHFRLDFLVRCTRKIYPNSRFAKHRRHKGYLRLLYKSRQCLVCVQHWFLLESLSRLWLVHHQRIWNDMALLSVDYWIALWYGKSHWLIFSYILCALRLIWNLFEQQSWWDVAPCIVKRTWPRQGEENGKLLKISIPWHWQHNCLQLV